MNISCDLSQFMMLNRGQGAPGLIKMSLVSCGRIHEHKRTFVRQLFAAKFVGLPFWYS